jgi:hypothetical protein
MSNQDQLKTDGLDPRVPRLDKRLGRDLVLVHDGVEYGTLRGIARKLNLNSSLIARSLKGAAPCFYALHPEKSRWYEIFSLSQAQSLINLDLPVCEKTCALLAEGCRSLPGKHKLNKANLVQVATEQYGTLDKWVTSFDVTDPLVIRWLRYMRPSYVKIAAPDSKIYYYSLKDASMVIDSKFVLRSKRSSVVQEGLPEVKLVEGIGQIGEKVYGTGMALARLLTNSGIKVSGEMLRRRLIKHPVEAIGSFGTKKRKYNLHSLDTAKRVLEEKPIKPSHRRK